MLFALFSFIALFAQTLVMSHYVNITESTGIFRLITQADKDKGIYCIDNSDMLNTSMDQTVLSGFFDYALNTSIPFPQVSVRCIPVISGDFISARKISARFSHDNTTISYVTSIPQTGSWVPQFASQFQNTTTYPSGMM
ncbi:hypothetical protein AYI68_g6331 [Smittium mucronatum]|uniref:Uncharacterized protein n=1 Tax=Smittium mucronatum TaxID=133383 RepID=A0A1R0GRU3_9FUNG|nr:hypothetical protein AYI68_g6331 [Smittium mucronatum]